jgi:Flp pilus assembly protein TadB
MPPRKRDTTAHRAIATVGWILTAVGLLGIIVWPGLFILWSAMIFFGAAALPRALLEWLRARRQGRRE